MKKAALITITIFSIFSLYAENITGIIINSSTAEPVTFAIIVLIEMDIISESNENGNFEFQDIEPGEYTLLVMADGYPEAEYPVFSETDNIISLKESLIEMEEIVVIEERFEEEAALSLDKSMMEDMSSGGDPFLLINTKEDVLLIENRGEQNAAVSARDELDELFGIPVFKYKVLFNYHGLPYYANSFYYDSYIPLNFLSYSFFTMPSTENFQASPIVISIFPIGILSSMDMYGPGRSIRMGTGSGLATSATLPSVISEQPEFSIETSMFQLNLLSKIKFTENLDLLVSVRKSFLEYTWIPLLWIIAKEINRQYGGDYFPTFLDEHLLPGFADGISRLIWRPSRDHTVFTDLFIAAGYTDVFLELLTPGQLSSRYSMALINYLNIQIGSGIKWEWDPGDKLINQFAVYNLYYLNSSTSNFQDIVGRGTHSTSGYPLNEVGFRNDFDFKSSESTEILATVLGRFLYGDYLYNYINDIDPEGVKEDSRKGVPIYEWEFSAYTGINYFLNSFTFNPGVRADFFTLIKSDNHVDKLRFSPVLNIEYDPGEIWKLHFSGGMSYDRFDYSEILPMRAAIEVEPNEEDLLSGRRLIIDDDFEKKIPARLFFGELDFTVIPEEWELSGGIFGHYMDDLSGVNLQSMQSETVEIIDPADNLFTDSQEQISMVPTDRLYSLGFHGRFVRYFGDNFLTIGYNYCFSRYGEEDKNTWIIPNNDIHHTVKTSTHIVLFNHWGIDFTINTTIGRPVTPNIVTEVYTDNNAEFFGIPVNSNSWEAVNEKYNEFYDYMPHFTWSLKTDFRWKPFGGDAKIFIDISNLFSFPTYSGPNIDEVGFVETSWLDRGYDWNPFSLLQLANARINAGVIISW